MNYIGEMFTFFCFNREDDRLALISYLENGSATVWFVWESQHINKFERFSSDYPLNLEFLNDYKNGESKVYAQKPIVSSFCFAQELGTTSKFHRMI